MINILDQNVVSQLINEVENTSNIERKKREYKAFRVFDGDQDYYVKERNKRIFPETWQFLRVSDVDIVGRVINKLAQSYNQQPQRKLDKEDSTNIYNEYLDDSNFHVAMQEFDDHYHNNFEAGLWVDFDQTSDVPFYFRTLKSFEYDRVINKRGITECVILSFPGQEITGSIFGDGLYQKIQDEHEDQERFYALWTNEHHVLIRKEKKQITFMEIPGNENNINPIGIIPFVFIQKNNSRYQQSTNKLAEKAIEWNSQNSVLNSYVDLSYGTWVLSVDDQQNIDLIRQGLYSFVKLPQTRNGQATTLQHVSPSPNIGESRQVLQDQLANILSDNGINSGSGVNGQNFNSALERMIANADVTRHIKMMQNKYTKLEKQVYEIVSAYLLEAFDTNIANQTLSLLWQESKPIQTNQEIIDNNLKLLQAKVISKEEFLMRVTPGLTLEQAIKMIPAKDESDGNNNQEQDQI